MGQQADDDHAANAAHGLPQLGGLSVSDAIAHIHGQNAVNEGNFKQIFRFDHNVESPAALARLKEESPESRAQLRDELASLETLRRQGIRVPEIYGHNLPPLGEDRTEGPVPEHHRTGVAMQYIDGTTFNLKDLSGDSLHRNLSATLGGQQVDDSEAGLAFRRAQVKNTADPRDRQRAQYAAQDLGTLENHLKKNVIADLQLMVDKHTGHSYVIDPLAVGAKGEYESKDEREETLNEQNAQKVSLLHLAAQQIASGNPGHGMGMMPGHGMPGMMNMGAMPGGGMGSSMLARRAMMGGRAPSQSPPPGGTSGSSLGRGRGQRAQMRHSMLGAPRFDLEESLPTSATTTTTSTAPPPANTTLLRGGRGTLVTESADVTALDPSADHSSDDDNENVT